MASELARNVNFCQDHDVEKVKESDEYNLHARQAKATDLAFFMQRQDSEVKDSWTVFNQFLSSDQTEQTAIGYLPIILAPAHEYDTLNTAVMRCLAISSYFGQKHTVLTVDQALYCRLMELKWSNPNFQNNLIPRLGGLHVSMNFLKAIGDHMNSSGLVEVWVESGLLGQGTVERVLAGKAYNKAMRAHKLTLQALWRLLMPILLSFVEQVDDNCYSFLLRMAADPQNTTELISYLQQDIFKNILNDFVESRCNDVNFCFWWQYMDKVSILLQYTRAQSDGIWELHLHSFNLMLPYFKRYDHLNYARWVPVYLAEMIDLFCQNLKETIL